MMKLALIVVDMQNDFVLEGSPLGVPDAQATVPVVNDLIQAVEKSGELVVISRDWHPANHGSFASNHPGHPIYDTVMLGHLPQCLWPDHCVQGTKGAELIDDLYLPHNPIHVVKGTNPAIDSYSVLYDNEHLQATDLPEILKQHGITDLLLCGLALDYCVKFTAMDARAEGYNVHVATDATQAVNLHPDDGQNTLEELKALGVNLGSSHDLKKSLGLQG